MRLPSSDVPLLPQKGNAQASGFLPLKCFKHSNCCYPFSSRLPVSSLASQREKLKLSGSRTLVCPTSSGTVPRKTITSCCSPPWPRPRLLLCSGAWTPTPDLGGGRTSILCVMSGTFLEWSTLRYVELVASPERLCCIVITYLAFWVYGYFHFQIDDFIFWAEMKLRL